MARGAQPVPVRGDAHDLALDDLQRAVGQDDIRPCHLRPDVEPDRTDALAELVRLHREDLAAKQVVPAHGLADRGQEAPRRLGLGGEHLQLHGRVRVVGEPKQDGEAVRAVADEVDAEAHTDTLLVDTDRERHIVHRADVIHPVPLGPVDEFAEPVVLAPAATDAEQLRLAPVRQVRVERGLHVRVLVRRQRFRDHGQAQRRAAEVVGEARHERGRLAGGQPLVQRPQEALEPASEVDGVEFIDHAIPPRRSGTA